MYENDFEKFPGGKAEKAGERKLSQEEDFAASMEDGVPEFAGEKFGTANDNNEYYGETTSSTQNGEGEGGVENSEGADNGLSEASKLIDYGLNAAAREIGVEATVQGIKSFDLNGSANNPIGGLMNHLGINTEQERKDLRAEAMASAASEQAFRKEIGGSVTEKTKNGAIKAIGDMKELIAEVEGADLCYEELRENARSAGKGYFEYAVSQYGVQDLTRLFRTLMEQKKDRDNEGKGGVSMEGDEVHGNTGEISGGEEADAKGDEEKEMDGDKESDGNSNEEEDKNVEKEIDNDEAEDADEKSDGGEVGNVGEKLDSDKEEEDESERGSESVEEDKGSELEQNPEGVFVIEHNNDKKKQQEAERKNAA